MVKETKFRHHPVRIEQGLFLGTEQLDLVAFRSDLQDAVIASDAGVDDAQWTELTLSDLVTVPEDAVAVVLDVEVNDNGSAGQDCYMGFCPTHAIIAGRISNVYAGNVADRKGSRVVIVELSTRDSVVYNIVASGAVFDYSIKLLGWLIGGTRLSKITPPAVDLLCIVDINNN